MKNHSLFTLVDMLPGMTLPKGSIPISDFQAFVPVKLLNDLAGKPTDPNDIHAIASEICEFVNLAQYCPSCAVLAMLQIAATNAREHGAIDRATFLEQCAAYWDASDGGITLQ